MYERRETEKNFNFRIFKKKKMALKLIEFQKPFIIYTFLNNINSIWQKLTLLMFDSGVYLPSNKGNELNLKIKSCVFFAKRGTKRCLKSILQHN